MKRVEATTFPFGRADNESECGGGAAVNLVEPFYLSEFPVSVGNWRKFAESTGFAKSVGVIETWDWGWTAVTPDNGFEPLAPHHPVVGVNFADCLAFCSWLSEYCDAEIRLPSEIEFEAAARAGCDCQHYCKAARAVRDQVRPYGDNAHRRPPVLAESGCNALGLRGMHGLVWHWCSDRVGPDGNVATTAWWVPREVATWNGKPAAKARIIRGGSFAYPVQFAHCASRSISSESDRNFNLGFRIAMSEHGSVKHALARLARLAIPEPAPEREEGKRLT